MRDHLWSIHTEVESNNKSILRGGWEMYESLFANAVYVCDVRLQVYFRWRDEQPYPNNNALLDFIWCRIHGTDLLSMLVDAWVPDCGKLWIPRNSCPSNYCKRFTFNRTFGPSTIGKRRNKTKPRFERISSISSRAEDTTPSLSAIDVSASDWRISASSKGAT